MYMADKYGIVITGAAGGVGWAYADEFMARGHDVVICDVSPKIDVAAALVQKNHPKPRPQTPKP